MDPRLVLVLEFHAAIDSDEIHRNGMALLDGSQRLAIVAFSSDPDLTTFRERLMSTEARFRRAKKAPGIRASLTRSSTSGRTAHRIASHPH